MTARPLALALLAAALALAGCGKTGSLEQPAPLFGAKAKADYDAKRAADAAARARDAETRRKQQDNTLLDPAAQPPTQAPYAPPLPGRTDPLGGPSNAPNR
jgi:predicted small lipoprotein YifL